MAIDDGLQTISATKGKSYDANLVSAYATLTTALDAQGISCDLDDPEARAEVFASYQVEPKRVGALMRMRGVIINYALRDASQPVEKKPVKAGGSAPAKFYNIE